MKKIIAYVLLCCFGITLAACSGKDKQEAEIAPDTVMELPKDRTSESIRNAIGSTPASVEKNKESGIFAESFENSDFAGYSGQISFYYNKDGSLLYYKWFLTESDKSNAKEIYSDVCKALEGSYGEGEENNSEATGLYTTSFTNDKQQITAQLQSGDSGYEISYMVTG